MSRDATKSRRVLGRGLDALIPAPATSTKKDFFICPIEKVVARADQPRIRFDEEALEELAQSIREQGVIQPIVVRRVEKGFEIIAGERRWRASQRAGLHDVPVVVKDVSPDRAFEMALVENLQREDLNPLERAEAYRRLVDEHGLNQNQLARRVGKGRSTITNSLRLLTLPEGIRHLLATGELSEGHGRALLPVTDQETLSALALRVMKKGMNVRQTERLARAVVDGKETVKRPPQPESSQVKMLEHRLRQRLGCKVQIKDRDGKGNKGTVVVHYSSSDQLEGLLDVLLTK